MTAKWIPRMTTATVQGVRGVTATAEKKSIHSSWASGGGEAGRTCYTAGIFNHEHGMNVAAPAKTVLLHFASNEPDRWVAKNWIAKSIPGPIQAQCHSNGQRISMPFPLPWNKRGARTVCSGAPATGPFRIAAGHGTE